LLCHRNSCEISGFHGCEYEDGSFLGYRDVLMMEIVSASETSVSSYKSTRRSIPEDSVFTERLDRMVSCPSYLEGPRINIYPETGHLDWDILRLSTQMPCCCLKLGHAYLFLIYYSSIMLIRRYTSLNTDSVVEQSINERTDKHWMIEMSRNPYYSTYCWLRFNAKQLDWWTHNTRAHAGHVIQLARASQSVVCKQSESNHVFLTSATSAYCRTLLASHSYLTCQNDFRNILNDSCVPKKKKKGKIRQYLVWWTVSVTQNSSLGCIRREEKSECIAERGGHFQHLILHCCLIWECNLFFCEMKTCQEWSAWLFDHAVLYPPAQVPCYEGV
jgi:hypothetical protein